MFNKRAFTLIELLVVIAIVAILAAILFPVFAQAKVAAKGAASISNIKQLGTASMIYSSDYDDMQVLNGVADPTAPLTLNGIPTDSWGWLLMPYMKSFALFQDPLTQFENPVVAGAPDSLIWAYRTQFAYAYSIHSPALYDSSTGNFGYRATSQTGLAKPADTVLFVKKKTRNNNPDWLWVGSSVWGGNDVNAPLCHDFDSTAVNPETICMPVNYWGSDAPSYAGQSFVEGGYTGGVAFRKSGQSIVTWSDGHAKTARAEQLAAGTNWSTKTPSAQVAMTDKEKYVWDAD